MGGGGGEQSLLHTLSGGREKLQYIKQTSGFN